MNFAISTNWNSRKHGNGHAVVEDVLYTGLSAVELGYSLLSGQADDIALHVRSGEISITSVHAFCPVPMGVSSGYPELYSICETNQQKRDSAYSAVLNTAEFAAKNGAKAVVLHAGRIPMRFRSGRLNSVVEKGHCFDSKHERVLLKAQNARDAKSAKPFEAMKRSLEKLIPRFESLGVILALENLPSIDAMPNEGEMQQLLAEFDSPFFGYWHDIGHGQVRENLGLINHIGIVKRMMPKIVGMHIHDVRAPLDDHCMPPRGGSVRFDRFRDIVAGSSIPMVFEPMAGTPREMVREAVDFMTKVWA